MAGVAKTSSKRSSKVTKLPGTATVPAESELRDLQFRLFHHLQSSLDLRLTLEGFYKNIVDAISVTGLSFEDQSTSNKIEIGELSKHSVQYNITSADIDLGKIVFYRNKRFLEGELAVLEILIGVLFYPLKNALAYQEAIENSMRDALTGIGNRNALDANFDREVKLAQRHKQALSVLLIDVDHFKKVNDRYGHRQGDKVLQHVTQSIKHSLRETDQLFRYGGEEFLVLLNNTSNKAAVLTAERIRLDLKSNPIVLDHGELAVTISIGVTSLVDDEDDAQSLFSRADEALYSAKNEGRDKVITLIPETLTSVLS